MRSACACPTASSRRRAAALLRHRGRRLGRATHARSWVNSPTSTPMALGRSVATGHRVHGNRSRVGRQRGLGGGHPHGASDDATRLAYAKLLPSQDAAGIVRFLEHAWRWFAQFGSTVHGVMMDSARACARHAMRVALDAEGSGICASGPIARRPAAKPSASSRPCSAPGDTSGDIAPRGNTTTRCPTSKIAPTSNARTCLLYTSPSPRD